MAEQVRAILWEAYEHKHSPKKSEWFWILGIMTLSVSVASIVLGNPLFGILTFIGGLVVAILATRDPKIITYAVTQRGLRIDDKLYPYTTLDSFCIDEEAISGPQLLVQSTKMFMPLLVIPLPEDTMEEIEDIISERLPEVHIEEPFAHKLLEFFGF